MSDPALHELARLSEKAARMCINVTLIVGGTIVEGNVISREHYARLVNAWIGTNATEQEHKDWALSVALTGAGVLYVKDPRITIGAQEGHGRHEGVVGSLTPPAPATVQAAPNTVMRVPVDSVDAWFLGVRKPSVKGWLEAE